MQTMNRSGEVHYTDDILRFSVYGCLALVVVVVSV